MQMLVRMGMLMVVGMTVAMLVGVGNTVVGVLVGVGMGMLVAVIAGADMVMVQMHREISFFGIFLYRDRIFIIFVGNFTGYEKISSLFCYGSYLDVAIGTES